MLVFQMCHVMLGTCSPQFSDNLHYNSYKECAIMGYEKSIIMINKIKEKDMEQFRTILSFQCNEVNDA